MFWMVEFAGCTEFTGSSIHVKLFIKKEKYLKRQIKVFNSTTIKENISILSKMLPSIKKLPDTVVPLVVQGIPQ